MNWTPSNTMDEFLYHLDCRVSTKQQYSKHLGYFFRWVSSQGIEWNNINQAHLVNYKIHLVNHSACTNTVNTQLVALRRFFGWLDLMGYHDNAARSLKNLKFSSNISRKALTMEQVGLLIKAIPPDKPRDLVLINLLIRTGLRGCEAARLDVEDLKIHHRTHTVTAFTIQAKGQVFKSDLVSLSPEMGRLLYDYIHHQNIEHGPVFRSESRLNMGNRLTVRSLQVIVKKYLKAIGLNEPGYDTHALRHTAAYLAYKAGSSLEEVQALLRHTSPNTTALYLKSLYRELEENNPAATKLDNFLQLHVGNVEILRTSNELINNELTNQKKRTY